LLFVEADDTCRMRWSICSISSAAKEGGKCLRYQSMATLRQGSSV
jgi:hypothetical protein